MVCPPPDGVSRGHVQYQAFALSSSEVTVELIWSFCICYLEFASTAHGHTYSLSLTVSPYFCSLRRGVSRCRYRSTVTESPGSQTSVRAGVEAQSVRAP